MSPRSVVDLVFMVTIMAAGAAPRRRDAGR